MPMITGQRYAILIGNSKFPSSNKRLQDLNCPETDVDGLEEILSSDELGGFDKIVPLKNLSHHEVLDQIGKTFDEAKKNDLILVYYSGHGKQDLEGQLYLATLNTRTNTANALTSSSVPVEQIRRFIKQSMVQTTVLILDCCYSGAIEGAFTRGGTDEQLQNVSKTRGTYIITASTGIQHAVEKEGDRYGLLTKYIIKGISEGLADRDGDGWIHMDELYEFIYQGVTSEGAQEPMKWALNIQGTQLLIARAGRREQIEARISVLVEVGQRAADVEDWETAINNFTEIQVLDPNHQATSWLSQAREQQRLATWYGEGLGYLNARKWSAALEVFQRISAVSAEYKETPGFIERIQQELRNEAIASSLNQAVNAITEEDWDAAISKLMEVLSLEPENDQAKDMLADAKQQKEICALYEQASVHYRFRRWPEARICIEQILSRVGEHKDVSDMLGEIERIEAEQERRRRADEEAALQQADAKFQEVEEAFAVRNWDQVAQRLYEISAIQPRGPYIEDKLATAQLLLLRSQHQDAIDNLYTLGTDHYNAHRWREAWICLDQVRKRVGTFKNTASLLREINHRRARTYIWYFFGSICVALFCLLILGLSLAWPNRLMLFGISYLLPVVVGLILLTSLYSLLQLSKDSDYLRQEIGRLRSSNHPQRDDSETLSQESEDVVSFDSGKWEAAVESRLSHRLSSLIQIDEAREIDPIFITCAEYQLFINESQKQGKYWHWPDDWVDSVWLQDAANQPIVGIPVQDAVRFCEWLTSRHGNQITYRLPTSTEAKNFPSNELAIAAWCTRGHSYDLVGLAGMNKRVIRQEIARLMRSGPPMSSSLSKRLITKSSGGQIVKSMGRALASLRVDFDPNEFIYDFNAAVNLKFTPALAHTSLENVARTMDLHGWGAWNTENAIGSLTPSIRALSQNDFSTLKKLAESLVETYRPIASSIASIVIALLEIIEARTVLEKRRAQRVYAVRILAYARVGYNSLISAVAKRDRRSWLKRWIRPDHKLIGEMKSLEIDQAQVAEVYWYWRIVIAREANELTSWEGIRIVRERSVK